MLAAKLNKTSRGFFRKKTKTCSRFCEPFGVKLMARWSDEVGIFPHRYTDRYDAKPEMIYGFARSQYPLFGSISRRRIFYNLYKFRCKPSRTFDDSDCLVDIRIIVVYYTLYHYWAEKFMSFSELYQIYYRYLIYITKFWFMLFTH